MSIVISPAAEAELPECARLITRALIDDAVMHRLVPGAEDRGRSEHEGGLHRAGDGRDPGDRGGAEGAADAVAGDIPALCPPLALLRRPGDRGQAATHPSGEHRPEQARHHQQDCGYDHPRHRQQQPGRAQQHTVGEGGDRDDFPPVLCSVEAAGDERAEQVRGRDRGAQQSRYPPREALRVGEEHDRDDRAPVGGAH